MELREFADKIRANKHPQCVLCNSGFRDQAAAAYEPDPDSGLQRVPATVISRWLKEVHGISLTESPIYRCLRNHD